REYLKAPTPGNYLKPWGAFGRIAHQRSLTDEVRHSFALAEQEDVRTATFNLIEFCQAVGEPSELLQKFEEHLEIWRKKDSVIDLSSQLSAAKFQLHMSTQERNQMLGRLKELEMAELDLEQLSAQIHGQDSKINQLKQQSEDRKERIDELRQQRNQWKLQKKEVEQRLQGMDKEKGYLRSILHMTLHTRTRLDYERSLVQLTPEQKGVVDNISLLADFLIKGGAGTGKTLVLLEALKRVNQDTLDLDRKKILLLTYTTTLVKYDRYLSDILDMHNGEGGIKTSDSYLKGLIEKIVPYKIGYGVLKDALKGKEHSLLNSRQIQLEIEGFIYSQGIQEHEYIDEMIPRRGLRIAMNRKQRKELWALKEEAQAFMEQKGAICKGYACQLDLEKLAQGVSLSLDRPDYIFLDESQDLSAMELKILKTMASTALIMAGDSDQTIYGIQSPYARAGIELQGRTRILKQNYRNSIPIHELAESFRRGNKGESDGEIDPRAFREGPVPELYSSGETEELYQMLVDKVKLFLEAVDYDPENICILAPQKNFLKKIEERLETAGIPSVQIQDPHFDFKEQGKVRISTLHSSKGLDLPVTMLFVPKLFYEQGLSEEAGHQQMRNLLYVAMTRAMEHLNVFVKQGSEDELVEELVGLMG
nr:AAA family ATPase [Spirochaetaceae bacterium]